MPRSVTLGLLLAPLLAAGCDALTADRFHCESTLGDAVSNCAEFYDFENSIGGQQIRVSMAAFCSAAGFSELTAGACPTEGRIGGCREVAEMYTKDTWSYEGGPDERIDDINCVTADTLIGPDGEPWDATPPTEDRELPEICTPEGTTDATTITFVNEGSLPYTVYWGDYQCNEQFMQVVPGGESREQQTYLGHAFRVRAGNQVPDAIVLDDITAETGGTYAASW